MPICQSARGRISCHRMALRPPVLPRFKRTHYRELRRLLKFERRAKRVRLAYQPGTLTFSTGLTAREVTAKGTCKGTWFGPTSAVLDECSWMQPWRTGALCALPCRVGTHANTFSQLRERVEVSPDAAGTRAHATLSANPVRTAG
jgi:hypothetical protein